MAGLTGAAVKTVHNPRQESAENDLHVDNDAFLDLGLRPTTFSEALLLEVEQTAVRWVHRINPTRIPATSVWNARRRPGIPARPTHPAGVGA